MTIHLYDHKYNPRNENNSSWHSTLSNLFTSHIYSGATREPNLKDLDLNDELIFVHSDGNETDWISKCNSRQDCHLVLVRAGGGQNEIPDAGERIHACFWSPSQFKDPKNLRASKFIQQVTTGVRLDWELLRPDPVETIFAAKLVIEARSLSDEPIQPISDNLLNAAQAVKDADTTDTSCLLEKIEKFELLLSSEGSRTE